jgi:hypothetical protein
MLIFYEGKARIKPLRRGGGVGGLGFGRSGGALGCLTMGKVYFPPDKRGITPPHLRTRFDGLKFHGSDLIDRRFGPDGIYTVLSVPRVRVAGPAGYTRAGSSGSCCHLWHRGDIN